MSATANETSTRRRRRLLRPPTLRVGSGQPEAGERHASWFELFFDLVFVVAVAELAHGLVADPTTAGFARFAILALPVWWIWILYTIYADRFDTDDVAYRLLGMVGMLAIVAMGVNLRGAMLAGEPPGDAPFILSYLAARAVVVVLYLRAARHVAIGRRLARVHVAGGVVAAAGLLGSLLLPAPERYAQWLATLLVEMIVPLFARRTIGAVPISLDHIPERYGLFTLIVLGESVVSVTTGLGDVGWGPRSSVIAVACFALACGVWWLHFDFVGTAPLGRSFLARQIWVFGLLPIVLGLTAVGAGALLAIEHADDPALSPGARWALGGGLALYLLAIGGVNLAGMDERWRRLPHFFPVAAMVAFALALSAFGGALPPPLLVCLLVGAFIILVGRKVLGMATVDAAAPAVRPRDTIPAPEPEPVGRRQATAQ